MKNLYSINEILKAVDELQSKKDKKITNIEVKSNKNRKDDIPQSALKLIEEAEKNLSE